MSEKVNKSDYTTWDIEDLNHKKDFLELQIGDSKDKGEQSSLKKELDEVNGLIKQSSTGEVTDKEEKTTKDKPVVEKKPVEEKVEEQPKPPTVGGKDTINNTEQTIQEGHEIVASDGTSGKVIGHDGKTAAIEFTSNGVKKTVNMDAQELEDRKRQGLIQHNSAPKTMKDHHKKLLEESYANGEDATSILSSAKKMGVDESEALDHYNELRTKYPQPKETPEMKKALVYSANTPFEIQKARIDQSLGRIPVDRLQKSGEGSRGGKIIGHTKSGKPIYDTHDHPSHSNFTSQDHEDAVEAHYALRKKSDDKLMAIHRKYSAATDSKEKQALEDNYNKQNKISSFHHWQTEGHSEKTDRVKAWKDKLNKESEEQEAKEKTKKEQESDNEKGLSKEKLIHKHHQDLRDTIADHLSSGVGDEGREHLANHSDLSRHIDKLKALGQSSEDVKKAVHNVIKKENGYIHDSEAGSDKNKGSEFFHEDKEYINRAIDRHFDGVKKSEETTLEKGQHYLRKFINSNGKWVYVYSNPKIETTQKHLKQAKARYWREREAELHGEWNDQTREDHLVDLESKRRQIEIEQENDPEILENPHDGSNPAVIRYGDQLEEVDSQIDEHKKVLRDTRDRITELENELTSLDETVEIEGEDASHIDKQLHGLTGPLFKGGPGSGPHNNNDSINIGSRVGHMKSGLGGKTPRKGTVKDKDETHTHVQMDDSGEVEKFEHSELYNDDDVVKSMIEQNQREIEDLLEKGGKRAHVGEVRMWGKDKWVKHQDGWVLFNQQTGKHVLETPDGKRKPASIEHVQHAKNSLALNNGELEKKMPNYAGQLKQGQVVMQAQLDKKNELLASGYAVIDGFPDAYLGRGEHGIHKVLVNNLTTGKSYEESYDDHDMKDVYGTDWESKLIQNTPIYKEPKIEPEPLEEIVGNKSFLIYTNPNNITNKAYLAIGTDVSEVKRSAREFPGSYQILHQGKGDKAYHSAKKIFSDYSIVEKSETNDLEKALPVGTINKYGEQKQQDGSWKYVKKNNISTESTTKPVATSSKETRTNPYEDYNHKEYVSNYRSRKELYKQLVDKYNKEKNSNDDWYYLYDTKTDRDKVLHQNFVNEVDKQLPHTKGLESKYKDVNPLGLQNLRFKTHSDYQDTDEINTRRTVLIKNAATLLLNKTLSKYLTSFDEVIGRIKTKYPNNKPYSTIDALEVKTPDGKNGVVNITIGANSTNGVLSVMATESGELYILNPDVLKYFAKDGMMGAELAQSISDISNLTVNELQFKPLTKDQINTAISLRDKVPASTNINHYKGINFDHDNKSAAIIVNTVREARHPDEYGSEGERAVVQSDKWFSQLEKDVIEPLEKLGYTVITHA